jgi:hypothetical protein
MFGRLASISLIMCSSAFAGDAPNTDSNGSQKVQAPSSPLQTRRPKNNKQVSRTQPSRTQPSKSQPDERSGPQSLSSAAAYASEHSASLPISSAPKSAPPSANPWTGFYVGAGAGVGSTQP